MMTAFGSAARRITDEVTAWPGVTADAGERGELSFKLEGRELGHLHGDTVAHFSFPKALGIELREQGRAVDHPVFPGKPGFAARRIERDEDARDVVKLMRLNYERIAGRRQRKGVVA